MTDDRTPFGTALDQRVRDEHPDLDQLVRVSTDRGTRIRRWRRVGASVAAVAGVAVVAVGIAALQGSDGTASEQPPIASEPTSASTSAQPDPSPTVPAGWNAPVAVVAAGWTCDKPADEKFLCSNGDDSVTVNWRDAQERKFYLDPGKADVMPGVHTFVSEASGRFFATVAPTSKDTTQAAVDEAGASLVWTYEGVG